MPSRLLAACAALLLSACAAAQPRPVPVAAPGAGPAPASALDVEPSRVSAPDAAPAAARLDSAAAGRQGIVSAADPRAAAAGAAILAQGGSAVDAAIATMLALSVVEPQSSGIGGGGFLVTADPAGRVETIDGRETAPMAAGGDWFLHDGQPLSRAQAQPGGRSVGVPGNLRLAGEAHARHGRLAWQALFAPAISLAREGFAITPRLFQALGRSAATGALDGEARALFYAAGGAPLPAGTLVRNEALARTLERLARLGPESFYVGPNAQALAGAVQAAPRNPAPLTTGDLAAYEAKRRPPVCRAYRRHRICGMGPPSSGGTTVLAILGQLERFDLAALGPDSPVAWHLIAESQRLAFADRERYLADPDFVAVPAEGLIADDYLARRSSLISPRTTMSAVAPGSPAGAPVRLGQGLEPAESGTSHFVAIDRRGNVASYTSTIESAFGSGLMVGGYYLNNELTDFSFVPARDGLPVANRVEGGKRPRSSMAPTLVFAPDGRLRLAIGAAGGTTIIAQVAKTIIAVVDWGLPAQQAIALPVLFAPGDTVLVEPGTALEAMIPALGALGHGEVRARAGPFKANAVERAGERWLGAADPRSEGAALAEELSAQR